MENLESSCQSEGTRMKSSCCCCCFFLVFPMTLALLPSWTYKRAPETCTTGVFSAHQKKNLKGGVGTTPPIIHTCNNSSVLNQGLETASQGFGTKWPHMVRLTAIATPCPGAARSDFVVSLSLLRTDTGACASMSGRLRSMRRLCPAPVPQLLFWAEPELIHPLTSSLSLAAAGTSWG